MSEAYKTAGPGHDYRGRCDSRGHRQRSKVVRACRGMASLGLIDEVLREDARRRRERERGQGGVTP